MSVRFNPLIFTGLDFTGGGGSVSIGSTVTGGDPDSVLIVDNSGNLADVPLSTGQLLIGRTSNTPIAATLTGTANQIIITPASGSITLSLPQSIATTSSPTFANLNLAPSGILDITGSGTLAIGTANADVINIGHSGVTVNVQGSTFYQNVTDLVVTDKLITVNAGGSAGSASNSGIEIEENSNSSQGYVKTSGDRLSWNLKAPGDSGQVSITPGSSGFVINQGSHNPLTLAAVGTSPTANAASLSAQVLTLQPADGSNPGVITAIAQTIGGDKTFSGNISANNLSGTNSGNVSLNAVGSSPNANGASLSTQSLTLQPANTSFPGVLIAADWNTFNSKQPAGNYITSLTGDATASGPGASAVTFATVNGNVGSFGTASAVSAITVNAKGLVTAAASTSIQITELQVTNLVSDLASKQNIVTGDISPTTFSGLANNTSNQTLTGLTFATSVSSFKVLMNIQVLASSNTYTTVEILGTRRDPSDWSTNSCQFNYSGDAVLGLDFNITSAGQVRISVGNISGFTSGSIKFRAMVLS